MKRTDFIYKVSMIRMNIIRANTWDDRIKYFEKFVQDNDVKRLRDKDKDVSCLLDKMFFNLLIITNYKNRFLKTSIDCNPLEDYFDFCLDEIEALEGFGKSERDDVTLRTEILDRVHKRLESTSIILHEVLENSDDFKGVPDISFQVQKKVPHLNFCLESALKLRGIEDMSDEQVEHVTDNKELVSALDCDIPSFVSQFNHLDETEQEYVMRYAELYYILTIIGNNALFVVLTYEGKKPIKQLVEAYIIKELFRGNAYTCRDLLEIKLLTESWARARQKFSRGPFKAAKDNIINVAELLHNVFKKKEDGV